MSEKEMEKLDEESVEKVSGGGIGSLKNIIKNPGAMIAKKYGGIPIKPPLSPINLIKHFKNSEKSDD